MAHLTLHRIARTRPRRTTRRSLACSLALACAVMHAHGCAQSTSSGVASTPRLASQATTEQLAQADVFDTAPTDAPVRGAATDAALVAALTRAARADKLTLDGRLADLALAIAASSQGGLQPPSYPLVRHHAHRAGIAEPTPQVWLASAGDLAQLLPALEQALHDAARNARLTHCGAAAIAVDGGVVLVLGLSTRALSLREPVPRSVPLGQRVTLSGELVKGYRAPVLAVTDAQGSVTRTPLGSTRAFSHQLVADHAGETTLELLASGPEGLAVVAVMPVMVGAPIDERAPTVDASPVEADASAVANTILAAIARERESRNLPPLRNDPRLTRIALAHSEDMVAHDFIAHTSKRSGDATARVRAAGLDALMVLENIGRGYSGSELHRGLMESPGHRGNILSPDARQVGIGVVAQREGDRNAFIVTELFTQLSGPK